ncbi:hypothetical protein M3181_12485 [Mesobacillus maritimus]|jgi:hypothetical protein|uniref:hypothetical protein n=1 Tax=Mesobacillus maritimus TaxID=1643336 RepID=UPI00203F9295|nr:hypothetical protein [Mesobacillus maritimus]MCM3669816.1 hypothetical protein [Mesobacillus maritimus]
MGSIHAANKQVEVVLDSTNVTVPTIRYDLWLKKELVGDFDVQVDYALPEWSFN